ncbi:MAG: beta-galactosidase [Verrucomicrobiia bacterium]
MNAKLLTVLTVLLLTSGASLALETETLFDGTHSSDWSTARDDKRLAKELSLSELAAAKDSPGLQWRFVSRGIGFNDIFLMKPIERRFDTLRVRIKNEGEPFELAVKVRDAGGAEWTAGRIPLARGGDWRWIEFPCAQWQTASWSRDANGKLDFPLSHLALIAFGVRPGLEYRLKVQCVEVVRPDRPVATIHELDLPANLRAGQNFTVRLGFTLDKPCQEEEASLVFQRGEAVVLRLPLALTTPLSRIAPGQRVQIDRLELRVPDYAFGGKMSVTVQLGEARVQRDGERAKKEPGTVTIQQRKCARTLAQVKTHNGTPTLFINGAPHNGMVWATYRPTTEVFNDFSRAGIDLFTFSGTPTEAGYGLSKTVWVAPGQFDYSEFDQRVMMLLQANPRAYFFPRLYLHAPKWWSAAHPDDIVLMDPGDGKPVPFLHSGGKPAPSWASEIWRRDTVAALKRLIAHVEASPYADRVVGYHLASGTTEEWMMWGGNENQWVDYSPANTARFRRWLKAKYGADQRLRTAWADPSVTLATAAIPTKAQRQKTESGSLRDPAKEQAVIDYYLYNADLVADTICYFTKAVKEIAGRRKITGVFYGYLLQLCGEQRQQNAGHLALEKVLASPDVDFITSPTSYAFRQLGGEGTSHFMSLFGSVRLHGKLWFDENDIRTSLSGGRVGEWGRPVDVAGDILQQDKELANCIVNGSAQWWFDVGSNKYNHPALMGRIGELAGKAREALALNRAPADETAFVVDEKSLCYLRVADPLGSSLLVKQLPALHRIGAPVGHYLVTDLARIGDRKLYIVPTSFAPTAADRKAINALKRDHHVLLFLWTPGVYRNGKLDETGMAEMTGIKLRLSHEPAALRVTLKPGHALTAGLDGVAYGSDRKTSPICYADDPGTKVLGTLPDGQPGLVVKEHGDWTAVYSSAPLLPASLLRRVAELAGVHLYIGSEDVVWASRQLLAVSVKEAGTRKIALPRKANVRDFYRGTKIGDGIDSFDVNFEDHATRVFVVE